jgi:hypothetical protein
MGTFACTVATPPWRCRRCPHTRTHTHASCLAPPPPHPRVHRKGAWWETAEGAAAKVAQACKDNVPELAVFRIDPVPEVTPAWPLAFWWDALGKFAVC